MQQARARSSKHSEGHRRSWQWIPRQPHTHLPTHALPPSCWQCCCRTLPSHRAYMVSSPLCHIKSAMKRACVPWYVPAAGTQCRAGYPGLPRTHQGTPLLCTATQYSMHQQKVTPHLQGQVQAATKAQLPLTDGVSRGHFVVSDAGRSDRLPRLASHAPQDRCVAAHTMHAQVEDHIIPERYVHCGHEVGLAKEDPRELPWPWRRGLHDQLRFVSRVGSRAEHCWR